jgi:DNA-binding transcriptional LysR family regulator
VRTLAALSTAFRAAVPDVFLELREATTAQQVTLLASGDLDVGLVEHPVDAADLQLGPEVAIAQGVVLPRASPLADQTEVALAELAGQDLVIFPRSAAPSRYDETLEICRRHGFAPVTVRHAQNPEFLVGLVAAGQGIAFDQGAIAQKEPRVGWRPLAGKPLVWRMSAAWPVHSGHPAAERFAEIAAAVLAGEDPGAPAPIGSPADHGGPRPWAVVFGPRQTSAGAER